MKIIGWMLVGLVLPWLILFGVGYLLAFPWHALAIVTVVVGVPLFVMLANSANDRRADAAVTQSDAAVAAFLHVAMMPDDHPDRTVLVPSVDQRAPRVAKVSGWAKAMGRNLR